MIDLCAVTYCGLYCGLCAQRNRIPPRAAALYDAMQKEGYEFWGNELPGFSLFWKFLTGLAESDDRCSCRKGTGGPPFCGIRKCASARQVTICPLCNDYPCHRILSLSEGYPTLLADGARIREIGLEAWVAEQEDRAKTGFSYADIRCHPFDIPE